SSPRPWPSSATPSAASGCGTTSTTSSPFGSRLGAGVVGLGRALAVADLVLDGVAGPLHTEVDHGLGLLLCRLEGVGPLHLAGHAVDLLVPLAPGHGPEVVPRPEPGHERKFHWHAAVIPDPLALRTTSDHAWWPFTRLQHRNAS